MIRENEIKTNTFKGKEKHFKLSKKVVGKSMQSVLEGDFLVKNRFLKLVPFLFYMLFLALIYIANIYSAEKRITEVNDAQNELKELNYEFITAKSRLMFISKRSEVARELEPTGIKEATVPPEKIFISHKKH